MLLVNGLYGHIQRNNLKAAFLVAAFIGLFALLQCAIQSAPFILMAQLDPEQRAGFAFNLAASRPEAQEARIALLRGGEKTEEQQIKDFRRRAGLPDVDPDTWSVSFVSVLNAHAMLWRFVSQNMLLVTIVLASIYLLVATWWNSLYIRYAMRARPLMRSEQPALYNLVENLSINAGIPCPAIEVIESDNLNAYASGLGPATARIGVTTGLVRKLGRDELEAVIAHELTHIRYRDSRLMAVSKACSDLILGGMLRFARQVRQRPLRTLLPFAILPFTGMAVFLTVTAVWAIAGLVMLGTFLVKAMILHSREFVADAGAIELTKNPAALISALRKIAGADDVGVTNPAAQAMMFSGSAEGWLSTHPTIESRIAAIRLHAGSTVADEVVHQARRQRGVTQDQTAGRSVAGRFVEDPSFAARRGGFTGADRPAPVQGFGRRRVQGTARVDMPATRTRCIDQDRFETQAAAREIWREEGVFSARHQEQVGEAGNNLFERWVMCGRLDTARKSVEGAGKMAVSYLRWGVFGLWMCLMAWGFLVTAAMR